MKILIYLVAAVGVMQHAYSQNVTDPQVDELSRHYEQGDSVKKMAFDINKDGVFDQFFTTKEANPDPTTAISDDQAGGTISWNAYVSIPNSNNFKVCNTLEEDGSNELLQGVAPLDLNPDQMYVGSISELGRYGIVTSAVKRSKVENSTIVYAYTWETDHFKRWKLSEFTAGQPNIISTKYLAENKRTHVVLQQIKP